MIRNFRWHRDADKWGPRRLAVVELGARQSKMVLLDRAGKNSSWEIARAFSGDEEENEFSAEELSRVLDQIDEDVQYLSVILGDGAGIVRLLSFPGSPPQDEDKIQAQIRQTLGVDETFAIRQVLLDGQTDEGEQRKAADAREYSVLAVAVKQNWVDALRDRALEAGMTPVSLLPAGVAAANLAAAEIANKEPEKAFGFLVVEDRSSFLLLYNQKKLVLVRQFKTGIRSLLEALMAAFELDEKTATEILNSGSFDLSGKIASSVNNWIHQVGISLDFIERRFGYRVDSLSLACTEGGEKAFLPMLSEAIGDQVVPWTEFEALQNLSIPDPLKSQLSSFPNPLAEGVRVMQQGADYGV